MAVLYEVPLDAVTDGPDGPVQGQGTTTVVFEADRGDVPRELTLAAAPQPGRAAARAAQDLASALDSLGPMLRTIRDRLAATGPNGFTVSFGVKLGGETGVIVAKGTAEVNLVVTMSWQQEPSASG